MKKAFYVIADTNNKLHFDKLRVSLRKFDKDTDLILFSDKEVQQANDPHIFYRATPYFAKQLFDNGYDELCHLDADQIITGNIDHIWDGDYDVATVLNDPTIQIGVWDIVPPRYYNNGLNVFKNKDFIEHWLRLCKSPHFDRYQYKEQDLLNILVSDYLNYKVKCLDLENKIHGEFAKPLWPKGELKDGKIMIDDKQLCVIHFGGGSGSPDKGKYQTRFKDEVVEFIDTLIKE